VALLVVVPVVLVLLVPVPVVPVPVVPVAVVPVPVLVPASATLVAAPPLEPLLAGVLTPSSLENKATAGPLPEPSAAMHRM
jgi:hypothetical protein